MSNRVLAKAALLVTVFIWGTTFPATKVALEAMPPFTLTVVRFALGVAIMLPLALAGRGAAARRPAWRELALAGLVGGSIYYACQNLGLVYTTASKAALILASVPALTAVLSLLLLKERMGLTRAAGVAASVLGVAAIILGDKSASWEGGGLVGDLLIVGSAIAWPAYTVLVKGFEGRSSPAMLAAGTMGFGAVFLLPLVGHEVLTQPLPAPTPVGWLAIGYLGLIASAAPFFLWNYALAHLDASEAAVYINLVPFVAVGTSALFLHEALVPAHLLGGALVLAGVWAAGKQDARASRPATAGR